MVKHFEEFPLFERVSEEDEVTKVLLGSTEEGKLNWLLTN